MKEEWKKINGLYSPSWEWIIKDGFVKGSGAHADP